MSSTSYARSLSFLLSQVGALAAIRFAELLVPTGLSARDFGVLSNIEALGPRTQQQLADELGIHRNNMVALIDDLESRRLLRRTSSETDRRTNLITSTASGRRAVDRALRLVPALDAELVACLSAEEHETLRTLVARVADGAGLHPAVHPHLAGRRARPTR